MSKRATSLNVYICGKGPALTHAGHFKCAREILAPKKAAKSNYVASTYIQEPKYIDLPRFNTTVYNTIRDLN